MYSRCLRCRHSLGRNADIDGLRVGRRVAFDTGKGRLWVVCTHCRQWNLVPIEERWEAVASCERLAGRAQVRSGSPAIGFARTTTGLELLRVGGLSDPDIANWRYGRRLALRQSVIRSLGVSLAVLALTLGLRAGVDAQSPVFGIYVAIAALGWIGIMWHDPPQLFPTAARIGPTRSLVWPWQRDAVSFDLPGDDAQPAVVVPRRSGSVRLVGDDAVRFLADILPHMNRANCAEASVKEAVAQVGAAEHEAKHPAPPEVRKSRRRSRRATHAPGRQWAPWELVIIGGRSATLRTLPPVRRLALEMAVTEDVERTMLESRAREIEPTLSEEEPIAGIADDLLVPDELRARLNELRESESLRAAKPTQMEAPVHVGKRRR